MAAESRDWKRSVEQRTRPREVFPEPSLHERGTARGSTAVCFSPPHPAQRRVVFGPCPPCACNNDRRVEPDGLPLRVSAAPWQIGLGFASRIRAIEVWTNLQPRNSWPTEYTENTEGGEQPGRSTRCSLARQNDRVLEPLLPNCEFPSYAHGSSRRIFPISLLFR